MAPKKRQALDEEIRALEEAILSSTPPSGYVGHTTDGGSDEAEGRFAALPLSQATLAGLRRGNFTAMTEIQRFAIPHALAGRDILGAAKTGSGKTLAFLVPLLEDLFRAKWSRDDPIGGLVVSPTRELALQIFEVLRVVGHEHAFVSCLLVGGTDVASEQKRVLLAQVCVCTPGRLLHHLEQTASFDASSLRVLVLDEADRVLDMGFKDQLEAILSYMPAPRGQGGSRQTMLFSATQTKSVADLARLSLSDPEFIAVHQADKLATPVALKQSYSITPLPQKLDVLWSFIRSHLKNKTIVFFSSCGQVRFADAAFRRMQPGVSVMALHGKLKPLKRTLVYQDFVNRPAAVLLATDIAARGLDFPAVDWVVQVDCPEDAASYIHRVGRTARYKQGGNALILLTPDEAKGFLPELAQHKVETRQLSVNPRRQSPSITPKLRALLASDPELKGQAQKAFKSYLRSVHLQPNKNVFDAKRLPMAEFAASLGLPSTPRVRFVEGGESGRDELRAKKNVSKKLLALEGALERGDGDEEEAIKKKKNPSKMERLLKRKSIEAQSTRTSGVSSSDGAQSDNDDDGLVVVRSLANNAPRLPPAHQAETPAPPAPKVAKPRATRISESGVLKGSVRPQRVVFDDEGEAVDPFAQLASKPAPEASLSNFHADADVFVAHAAKRLREQDALDREEQKRKTKQKKLERKIKRKSGEAAAAAAAGVPSGVVLGGALDEGSEDDHYGEEEEEERQPALTKRNSRNDAKTASGAKEESAEAQALRLIEERFARGGS